MTRHTLLLVLLLTLTSAHAAVQEPQAATPLTGTIEGIEISGIPEGRLSPALRDDLLKLRGQPYDAEAAAQLADRIQNELPEYIAAARTTAGSQAGQVRVVFVVARISDDDGLGENINERYPVESVELEGIPRSEVSDALWGEMQKMVGQPLNNTETERIRKAIESELGVRYAVVLRVRRGEKTRQLSLRYVVTKMRFLRWIDPQSFASYHPKQGPTFFANFNVQESNLAGFRFRVGLGSDGDSLIERYKGFRLGFDKSGLLDNERVGFRFHVASYGTQWKNQTLEQSERAPELPGIYRSRREIEPSFAFAFSRGLLVTAGFNATALEMQFPETEWKAVRLGVGSVNWAGRTTSGGTNRSVALKYDVRTAAKSLESDFVYTRHFWQGSYAQWKNRHLVQFVFMGGRLTGTAPLFERFSIGNTQTARGWNKFDISPLGASRMAHGSFEAGYRQVRLYYDAGSVWNAAGPIQVRQSIGLTFGAGSNPIGGNRSVLTVGAAIRNARLEPTAMLRIFWR